MRTLPSRALRAATLGARDADSPDLERAVRGDVFQIPFAAPECRALLAGQLSPALLQRLRTEFAAWQASVDQVVGEMRRRGRRGNQT